VLIALGEVLENRLRRDRAPRRRRKLREGVSLHFGQAAAQAARLAQLRGDQKEHGELRREGLGRGHADLRTGVRGEDRVRHARDLTPGDVYDGRDRRAFPPRLRQRGHRVRRLARLRDAERQGAVVDDGPAIAELAAVIDFDGQARHPLDQELADQRRVPRRAAGEKENPVEPRDLLR
jgi:hypothetical protein